MGQFEEDKMTKLALPTPYDANSSVDMNADQHLSLFSGKPLMVLIDSRSLTREGLARLLSESESLKLIPVSRCSELLEKGREVLSEVEIVLLNIGSAAIGDPEIVRDIASLNEALPNAPIMIICDREDSHHIGEALRQGIRGYIPTTSKSQILMVALSLVQAGGTFVPAGALTDVLSRQLVALDTSSATVAALDPCGLTPRQREVLNLLRQGKANKTIAYELDMAESTVKVHVRQIMRKMRVSNRTEAALLACVDAKQKLKRR